ncbi:MAG: nuclear transport factor 2 family protein [Anaerolineales bacterium]
MSSSIDNQNIISKLQTTDENFPGLAPMVIDSLGKQFYVRQVQYLIAKDVDRLVDENYQDDAVLISADSTVRGKPALKEHFHNYFNRVTIKEVKSTDLFVETDDTILFEATVETNFGIAKVYDAMVLRDSKVAYHFTGAK